MYFFFEYYYPIEQNPLLKSSWIYKGRREYLDVGQVSKLWGDKFINYYCEEGLYCLRSNRMRNIFFLWLDYYNTLFVLLKFLIATEESFEFWGSKKSLCKTIYMNPPFCVTNRLCLLMKFWMAFLSNFWSAIPILSLCKTIFPFCSPKGSMPTLDQILC